MATKRTSSTPVPAPRQPVEAHALNAVLHRFVTGFVVEDKRVQVHQRLRAAARRGETLGTLPRWIAGRTAPLEGPDRSPAGLHARFGELIGVQLDAVDAYRITLAGALDHGRHCASLFIADAGRLALITVVGGPPLLCSR